MSTYDTYGEHQLKVDPTGRSYSVGEKSPLPDGVYMTNEGCIVIYDGFFIAQYKTVTSKWGDIIEPGQVLDHLHPLKDLLDTIGEHDPT